VIDLLSQTWTPESEERAPDERPEPIFVRDPVFEALVRDLTRDLVAVRRKKGVPPRRGPVPKPDEPHILAREIARVMIVDPEEVAAMKVAATRDVADGLPTLEQIGNVLGFSRERVRQVEARVLCKFRRELRKITNELDALEEGARFDDDDCMYPRFAPGCRQVRARIMADRSDDRIEHESEGDFR
jgi:hypothetical protein